MARPDAERGGAIMEWFKAFQDGILRGSLCATNKTTQLIWIKLLAIENETRLRDGWLHYAPGRPMTREYLAMVCQVTVEELEEALREFQSDFDRGGHPRIEIAETGEIFIKNWEKYQAKPERIVAKEVAQEKARQTRQEKEDNVIALARQVRELNQRLETEGKRQKWVETPDGLQLVNTDTGEVIEKRPK